MITKQRLRALQTEISHHSRPGLAWQSLKAKHLAGKIQLTYQDLEWIGYFLGYKYGWATAKAFELGIFTLKIPSIVKGTGFPENRSLQKGAIIR